MNSKLPDVRYDFASVADQFMTFEEGEALLSGELPKAQIEFYEECARDESIVPLMYARTAHVFYKGVIDVGAATAMAYEIG